MNAEYKNIKPLFISGKNNFSRWISYLGLGIGVLLLFVSIQIFVNIEQILKENNPRKSGGYDFISISKTITNENMGKDNSFSKEEIAALKNRPAIEAVSPLISNQFRVTATAGNVIPFSTDLFMESIDDNFIDTLPPSFSWQAGQTIVPVIFSSDFLEMYNVFAPAQGLPQLSPETISSVNIFLVCSGPDKTQTFKGNIVALSDRVNSLLVPENFMNWANFYFTGDSTVSPSRVYLKTKDANNPQFISFLDQNNYHVNKEKIKFGRIKGLLENIVSSLGIFGVLVIVLALMLFSFYLQLMIARSKDNLQLLLTLGYSPKWLARSVSKTWLPVYASIIVIALIITEILHLAFGNFSFAAQADLPILIHWSVFAVAIFLLLLTTFINSSLVKKELEKII
jgi:hypothetical protein